MYSIFLFGRQLCQNDLYVLSFSLGCFIANFDVECPSLYDCELYIKR